MTKETFKYILFFFCSLGLAFWASLPANTKDSDRKAIVSLSASQIAVIQFTSKELKMSATALDSKWWISTEKNGTKDRFMASSKMKEILSQLSPLEAIRIVGKIKPEQEVEFGLKEPTSTVVFSDAAGKELLKLEIGKQAFGSRNFFARESTEQRVVLLASEFISDFEHPELRIFERTISTVVFEEVQSAEVSFGAKSRKFSHLKRDDKGNLLWTDEAANGSVIAAAKSWFERLDRVRIVSFPSLEEAKQLDAIQPFLKVDLVGLGQSKDKFEFVKKTASDTKGQSPLTDYFVKTEFLGGWARVGSTRLEPIEKDLPTLFAQ